MEKGRVREFFPGGNTSLGFFSYYDYIIPPDATRIIVIKGGPGVGKSSFMKYLVTELNKRGFEVELHHCSSDNNSLDGVVFPQLEVALIDGTSPHIVDPRNPGAVDEIMHLGDYWDEKGLRQNKEGILMLNREVGRAFQRVYRYLGSAKILYDDLKVMQVEGLSVGAVNQKAAELSTAILGDRPIAARPGKLRKLFASAITPEGFKNYLPSLLDSLNKVIALTGAIGTGKSALLEKITQQAVETGLDCEAFYCAFNPHKIEHLIIPALDLGITTATEPHLYDLRRVGETIDMDRMTEPFVATKYGGNILKNRQLIETLFEEAFKWLREAKSLHDRMEEFYIPNMNFHAIGELREKTLERLLSYAEEKEVSWDRVV